MSVICVHCPVFIRTDKYKSWNTNWPSVTHREWKQENRSEQRCVNDTVSLKNDFPSAKLLISLLTCVEFIHMLGPITDINLCGHTVLILTIRKVLNSVISAFVCDLIHFSFDLHLHICDRRSPDLCFSPCASNLSTHLCQTALFLNLFSYIRRYFERLKRISFLFYSLFLYF